MSSEATYVVTLHLDPASFEWLQELRTRYFPPERNFLPAHLTLLHRASLDQVNRLKMSGDRFARNASLPIRFGGLRFLGGGSAVVADSAALVALRREMMQIMTGEFSRQDQQPFKAHVTVQNKVDRATAIAVFEHLSVGFVPRTGYGLGLMIWRYLGGPWSLDSVLSFAEDIGA